MNAPRRGSSMTTLPDPQAARRATGRSDALREVGHAQRVLAQARVGVVAPLDALYRAIDAIDVAWCVFGRSRVRVARQILAQLERGQLPQRQGCIDAVRELGALLASEAPA